MFESFFIGPTVTLGINICHPERIDKSGGSIEDTVGNFPIDVNHGAIQSCHVDLIPGLGPMQSAVDGKKLPNTMGIGCDETTTDDVC
jgi:hypothetical protein